MSKLLDEVKAFLTRNRTGVLLTGGAGVAGYALYRKHTASNSSSTGAAVPAAAIAGYDPTGGVDGSGGAYDSTGNDVYDALQQPIEQLNTGLASLQGSIDSLNNELPQLAPAAPVPPPPPPRPTATQALGNTHAHVQRNGQWGYLNGAGAFVPYAARPAGSGWSTSKPAGGYETFFTRSGTTYYKSTAPSSSSTSRSSSTRRTSSTTTRQPAPKPKPKPKPPPPHKGGPMKAI